MKRRVLLVLFVIPLLQGCATLGNQPGGLFNVPTTANNPLVATEQILKETDESITLAIVVQNINHPTLAHQSEHYFKEWAKGIEAELISGWEQQFLTQCSKYKGFKLVDRNAIEKLVDEFNFQMQGYTREIDAKKIGQFLNASHLLVVSFSRFHGGTSFLLNPVFNDSIQVRLIKVEDASVVSVYTSQQKVK